MNPSRVSKITNTSEARLRARQRWGEQRRLRLDELDPETRRLILALVEQDRAKREADDGRAA